MGIGIIETPKSSGIGYQVKGGGGTVKIDWNPNLGQEKMALFQKGQRNLDIEVMELLKPYMQRESGKTIASMSSSTTPGTGEILVQTPYAACSYYSRGKVGEDTQPLRGPYYFERMKHDKKEYLHRYIAAEMGAKS